MSYFHVRLTVRNERTDEVKLDLTEGQLDRQFIAPYRAGEPLTVNGRTVEAQEISRILVSSSEDDSAALAEQVRERQRNAKISVAGGASIAWRVAARATDVTDDFITGPPGAEASADSGAFEPRAEELDKSVFVVHGRNEDARSAMYDFLNSLGLRPVEWSQAVALTGEGSPYPGVVLRAALRVSQAIVVLLTPDEFVQIRPEYVQRESEKDVAVQARPNVIFEAGMALAMSEQRTIVVEFGAHRTFSDIDGRHLLRLENSPQKRNDLIQRLRTAGCSVDTSGNYWMTAGDFTPPVVAGSIVDTSTASPSGISSSDLL